MTLTNKLRTDIQQRPAGINADVNGSVLLTLIEAEPPAAPRSRYTPEQLDRALTKFDQALELIGWQNNENAKRLFLVRQMIARRLGFSGLQNLFTGRYASNKAQDEYTDGNHFLLKPFVTSLCPLLAAFHADNNRQIIEVLKEHIPAFDITGRNKDRLLKEMLDGANRLIRELDELWQNGSIGDVLNFARENSLCSVSERLAASLDREPRDDDYDPDIHSEEKSDWLVDEFLTMPTNELFAYYDFVSDHTPLSTQRRVRSMKMFW